MDQKPLVSVISVNYHQDEATCAMLHSLMASTYPKIEAIIVDNDCPEDKSSLYQTYFPGVKVVNSPTNLGFAGGNNLGLQHASGELYFFLNNDTEIAPYAVEALVERLGNANIGAAGSKIRFFEPKERLQYAGFTKVHFLTGRNKTVGLGETDHGQYEEALPMPYLYGAAFMVKKEVIEKIGPMPEAFFLYYEEIDWCAQINKAGYQLFYEPKSIVYHKDSLTVGSVSPVKTYYQVRNRVLFMRRNYSKPAFFLFSLYFISIASSKALFQYYVKKQTDLFDAHLQGLKDAFSKKNFYGKTWRKTK